MNAVERLLAHAERVAAFFDEVLSPKADLDPLAAESVHRRLSTYTDGGPFMPPTFELKTAPPRYRKALSADRLDLLTRWQSEQALETAIRRATGESHRSKKPRDSGVDPAPRALEIYCDLLAERERLLDQKTMQRMLADVVADSLLWGPHAATVASLSESLTKALGRLRERPRGFLRDPSGRPFMETGGPVVHWNGWLSERKAHLRPAIDALQPYAQPPKAATSEKKPGGTEQKKRRDRKGIGGRPAKFTMKFVREVVAARERDQKHAAKARKRLPPFPRWLADYCTEKKIAIRERFPPAAPGESWSVTANRFWKAARKRLRDAETNCH
jgi:hypothetical protein